MHRGNVDGHTRYSPFRKESTGPRTLPQSGLPAASKTSPPAAYAPGPPDERMSKVDTAWLRMDHPANLMQIIGVWQLAPRRELCGGVRAH